MNLIKLNQKQKRRNLSCEQASMELSDSMLRLTYQHIEEWGDKEPGLHRYPSQLDMTNRQYLKSSHVQAQPFNVPLARSLNFFGHSIGSDKLGHFTSFGRRYMERYLDILESLKYDPNYTEEQKIYLAKTDAVQWGFLSEGTVVGKIASGVFSYADLEANYQGLEFLLSFCDGKGPYELTWDATKERWDVDNLFAVSLEKFINPDWDEVFNNSVYAFYRWDNVQGVFVDRYCALRTHPLILERFTRYKKSYTPSFAKLYQLKREGQVTYKGHVYGKMQLEHDLFYYCDQQ